MHAAFCIPSCLFSFFQMFYNNSFFILSVFLVYFSVYFWCSTLSKYAGWESADNLFHYGISSYPDMLQLCSNSIVSSRDQLFCANASQLGDQDSWCLWRNVVKDSQNMDSRNKATGEENWVKTGQAYRDEEIKPAVPLSHYGQLEIAGKWNGWTNPQSQKPGGIPGVHCKKASEQ